MEAVGVMARAGQGGDPDAIDADRAQVLRDGRLDAEQHLRVLFWPMMSSAAIYLGARVQIAADPPAWLLAAWEAGDQRLRARLFQILNTLAIAHAMAVVQVLCLHLLGEAPAERALPGARLFFVGILASVVAAYSVDSSEHWGEMAATFMAVVVIAVVLCLYAIGELNGFVIKIAGVFGA